MHHLSKLGAKGTDSISKSATLADSTPPPDGAQRESALISATSADSTLPRDGAYQRESSISISGASAFCKAKEITNEEHLSSYQK